MLDDGQRERKQGPVTVLALFIAVLLGLGGAASAAPPDRGAARLGHTDTAKPQVLRTLSRSSAEEAEPEDALAVLPPAPEVQRRIISARASSDGLSAPGPRQASRHAFAYRARAPPAA